MRQEGNDPITVGINSPGGSLSSLEVLLGLISEPDQNGQVCRAVTVSLNHGYSAAANLLASGAYSIALPHSEILFHDVRFGGMEDVTPGKARVAASSFKDAMKSFRLSWQIKFLSV
jgi:ATP-dependent protease ClpP protease subunit